MKVLPTTLEGVLLLELDTFEDARGRVITWPAADQLVMAEADRAGPWLRETVLPP